jgi:hypothetical protein
MHDGIRLRIRNDDPRLGRHINHDPRSRAYQLDVSGLGLVDVSWTSHIPILNQLDLGKCTAEAAVKALSCDPFWQGLPTDVQTGLNDDYSTAFYHDETVADDYPGTYPPDDTGSDGLTSGKVAQSRNLINGFEHTFSVDDALKGLQLRPACWGTLWKTGMDAVDQTTGKISYSGTTRGGHELCLYGVNVAAEQVWFYQSWGAWGYQNQGIGWISFDDFALSLKDQGDVTFFTPLSEPAPQPKPPVTTSVTFTNDDVSLLDTWAGGRHAGVNRKAAQAWQRGTR